MAKKLFNPLEDPPTASSSEDDEVGSSDEESSQSPINVLSAAATKAARGKSTAVSAAKQSTDSDSGSETKTDSGSDSKAKNPPKSGSGKTVSFSAAKPTKDPTSSVTLALPAAKSGKKRPVSEGTPSKDKRAKIVSAGEEETLKKPGFHKLWTNDDEISILQGIVDFKGDTGKYPNEDSNGFYEFVKNSISFDASKSQVMDKIRSLKKKFMAKEGKNGEEPKFVRAHDQQAYKLSKHLWGPEGIAFQSILKSDGLSSKSRDKKKLDTFKQELMADNLMVQSDWFEKSFLIKSIAGFGVDEHHVKQNWCLVPVEGKRQIAAKLNLLQEKELEFILEKSGFLHEVTAMMAEATKKKH